MSTLYELTDEYKMVLEMSEDPDVDDQVLADTLEGIEGEIEYKADGYARVIREMEADARALKTEEERLSARRATIENRIKYLKARLQYAMLLVGKPKFKTELFSFNIQKNPAAVIIDTPDLDEIPAEYLIQQPPKVDKQRIKEDLKAGADLLGIAHLEQTESLRIR